MNKCKDIRYQLVDNRVVFSTKGGTLLDPPKHQKTRYVVGDYRSLKVNGVEILPELGRAITGWKNKQDFDFGTKLGLMLHKLLIGVLNPTPYAAASELII